MKSTQRKITKMIIIALTIVQLVAVVIQVVKQIVIQKVIKHKLLPLLHQVKIK